MSLGIKTAQGIQRIHSVRVDVDTNLTISRVPLEDGGFMNSSVGDILSPNDSVNNRCRGTYAVLLDAGEYEITKSPTAAADLQINVSAYQRDSIYDSGLSRALYVLATSIPGYWSESGQPFTLALSAPAYISITVRKSDNAALSAVEAGGYVIIRKT